MEKTYEQLLDENRQLQADYKRLKSDYDKLGKMYDELSLSYEDALLLYDRAKELELVAGWGLPLSGGFWWLVTLQRPLAAPSL